MWILTTGESALGIKQISEDPWETLPARYHIGSRVAGKVRSLTDFGAFVEIEDGIDGLVHVSDISWTKRVKHPSDVLKKGQQVDAVITNIDVENRRLSLSIKDLEPNAWDRFFETHRLGDTIKGKVVRFANFGAFVEIEEGIEGLCHVSELSDERVEKPEDAVKIGQVLPFKVLKLDPGQKKIGLSARAVGKENDPEDVQALPGERQRHGNAGRYRKPAWRVFRQARRIAGRLLTDHGCA